MFIAIDIGNTNTVLAIYEQDKLVNSLSLASNTSISDYKIISRFNNLLAGAKAKKENIEGVGISSVVPKLTKIYSAVIKKIFNQQPLVVSSKLNLGITLHYDNPKLLGADRICNAVAGYSKYGGPLIIIDLGTATTYDVVASNGDFLGGVIVPGIKTSAIALHKQTAKLPRVELNMPQNIICTNTVKSMQAGILWGSIDGMAGIVNRIQQELSRNESKKAEVIATGGFSKFIAKHAPIIQHVEPYLVLDGINLIYKRLENLKRVKNY